MAASELPEGLSLMDTILAHNRITEKTGAGGMGVVCQAG